MYKNTVILTKTVFLCALILDTQAVLCYNQYMIHSFSEGKVMRYERSLYEKYTVDVFVAGGGPAGIAAAVAAARNGKSVFIAEAQGCFGGLGTAGLVPAFAPFDDGVNVLAAGIGYEIRKSVSKDVPLKQYWTPIKVEELKRAYDKLITESGVKFSFFTTVCDVITNGDKVEGVVLHAKSGLFTVKAKIYIDCTGDGDLCAYAGGTFEKGDENGSVMPATLCSLWANLDYSKIQGKQDRELERAINDGIFTNHDRHLPGFFDVSPADGIGGGNIGHTFGTDPLDERSLTDAMLWARQSLLEYERYYKEYLCGYDNITLVNTAAMLGVRESRRIKCDYMLNVEDFLERAVFEDEIGRYCYPIDIHVMNTDEEEYKRFQEEYLKKYRYKKGESYGIPYRSLIPESFSNVLVAGRCMGTDRNVQASIRVMPGCFITGQAAGVAAALATETENVRKVDIKQLQSKLKQLGAYLPNA